MASQADRGEIDLREHLARIREMGANTDRMIAANQKLLAEAETISIAAVFQGGIAVAALLGAGAAIAKLFFP